MFTKVLDGTLSESVQQYASQIILISILSIITIFRKELSCNSVYLVDKQKPNEKQKTRHRKLDSHSEWERVDFNSCPLIDGLSDCVQIKCLTYLHPSEILTLGSVSKKAHSLVNKELLWYRIFLRDFAYVLLKWKYGIEKVNSLRDSHWNCPEKIVSLLGRDLNGIRHRRNVPSMKEFYLVFAQTWSEFIIAGHSENPTLVSIHGHVFNITSFLDEHPGSPETIIMQGGGKDASSFFEAVGHSKSARMTALQRLVEIVDLSCCRGDQSLLVGLRKDYHDMNCVLPLKRSKVRKPWALSHLRQKLEREKKAMLTQARKQLSRKMAARGQINVLGNINVYFDPICYRWKAWYLDLDFQPIFMQNIENDEY